MTQHTSACHSAQTLAPKWIPQADSGFLGLQGQFPLIDFFWFCHLSSTNIALAEKVCFSNPLLAAEARPSAIKAYQSYQLRFFQSPTCRGSKIHRWAAPQATLCYGTGFSWILMDSPGHGLCLCCSSAQDPSPASGPSRFQCPRVWFPQAAASSGPPPAFAVLTGARLQSHPWQGPRMDPIGQSMEVAAGKSLRNGKSPFLMGTVNQLFLCSFSIAM